MNQTSFNDIIIQFAIERMENRGKKKRKTNTYDFQPEDFKDFVKDGEELKERLGRKWKINLQDIGLFASKYQHITSNYHKKDKQGNYHPVSILPIACTSSYLLDIFKKPNPRYASRLIEKCKRIGFLFEVKSTFRFGFINPNLNECKEYAYNKDVEYLVKRICKEEGIDIQKENYNNNPIMDTFEELSDITDEEYSLISLRNSHLHIKKCNIEALRGVIWKKYYDLIKPRSQKIEEMNRTLPEVQIIKFRPNLKYGKRSLRRISIRATSPIVSSKVHKDENANFRGIYRDDYLMEYFGGLPYFEYDVCGSIFQVSHLLNYGEWCGDKRIDPYEIMFGRSFEYNEARKAYKLFAMSLYFDDLNMIYAHSLPDITMTDLKYGKRKIKDAIANESEKMKRFAGESLYNEIFLHESLIYIDFVYELRKRGIKVVQIYDGFYIPEGDISVEELELLMCDCAMNYLNEYRNWLKCSQIKTFKDAA